MITALIGHRAVGKTALLKRPEILFSRREDVILSDLDFEIENRAGRSIASNNLVMSAIGTKRTSERRPAMSAFGGKADISGGDIFERLVIHQINGLDLERLHKSR